MPLNWLNNIEGKEILCLTSGGGQQGPILAASNARVTIYDNSPDQLEQDRFVAKREGLELTTIQGDMADLSVFQNNPSGMERSISCFKTKRNIDFWIQ